jgi:hypothetical protein
MSLAPRLVSWGKASHVLGLAQVAASEADAVILTADAIRDDDLLQLWQFGRQFTSEVTCTLNRGDGQRQSGGYGPAARDELQQAAIEWIVGELALRHWCSLLLTHEKRQHRHDIRPIVESTMAAVEHARHGLLTLLNRDVQWADVNRFRQHCERWTDVLLGPTLVRFGEPGWSHDARRAWEFGEEQVNCDTAGTANVLWRTGLAVCARQPLADTAVDAARWDHWSQMMRTVLRRTAGYARLPRWFTTAPLRQPIGSEPI